MKRFLLTSLILPLLFLAAGVKAQIMNDFADENSILIAKNKTVGFYRHFSKHVSRHKNMRLNSVPTQHCDYDNPRKVKFCPPALPPTMHGTDYEVRLEEKETPYHCLDDHDDPVCVDLWMVDAVPRITVLT